MDAKLSAEEMAKIFEEFLNDKGLYYQFEDFVKAQGYELSEFYFDNE